MVSEADKVGPCVALTIIFFMITFTFTVLVYLVQVRELQILVVVLWPVTGFLIVLTFILYLYRSSDYVFVLEGHRVKIGRKSELRRAENKPERRRIITENPWFQVKVKPEPGKDVERSDVDSNE